MFNPDQCALGVAEEDTDSAITMKGIEIRTEGYFKGQYITYEN